MTSITGQAEASVESLYSSLLKHNNNPKISCSPKDFVKFYIEEGNKENIRGDIAFFQCMKETGWLQFGGQVLPEQNNFAGIGALNNQAAGKGAWFKTPQIGIKAHIQHLKAYANKEKLNSECVDPRFHLVARGIAPNWENLNGKWAVPGKNYGEEIIKLYNDYAFIIKEGRSDSKVTKVKIDNNIYEVESILYRNTNYIKLRDFEKAGYIVSYDEKNSLPCISAIGKVKETIINIDNKDIAVDAININDNNYVKLQDFTKAGYEVSYNRDKNIPVLNY